MSAHSTLEMLRDAHVTVAREMHREAHFAEARIAAALARVFNRRMIQLRPIRAPLVEVQ